MAYNNYYPATYQSPIGYSQYPQLAMPQTQQIPQVSMAAPSQNSNGIIWVQGEVAAKAYPVAPGNSILLMDSEDQRFYIKSADASGMPLPLRCFSYTEEVSTQQSFSPSPEIDTSQFITRQEFEERVNEQSNRSRKERSNAQ